MIAGARRKPLAFRPGLGFEGEFWLGSYFLPREEREREEEDRDEDERREPLLDRARLELLREGRPALGDERRCDEEARDGRLLGRLELLDARDGGRAEGRLDERLGVADRPLLLPDGLPDVLGRAERLRDGRELRPDRAP